MSAGVVIGVRLAGALLAMTLALPATAAAQRPGGPFSGLFGRTPPHTGQDVTIVEARTTVGGQYDGFGSRDGEPGAPLGGAIAAANAGIAFERRTGRLELRGRTEAARQEFLQAPRFGGMTYDSRLTVASKITTRLTLDGTASAMRSPFFQIGFVQLPGDTPGVRVPADRLTTQMMPHDDFEGMVGFTSQFAKRSSISASVLKRATLFRERADGDYSVWGTRGELRHRLSRLATLRLVYGREQARQAVLGPEYVHEVIDAGIDFDRELALARRLTFSFYSQNSILREAGGPRRYRLNGGVTLRRGFGRSWSAALAANRDTHFEPGLIAPLFSDGISLTAGGLLKPRMEWTGSIGGQRGRVGYDALDSFTNFNATTRLSTALVKKTGLFLQYTYYDYTVPPAATIAGLLPALSRQQASVGITMWLPIYTNVRQPRDPR